MESRRHRWHGNSTNFLFFISIVTYEWTGTIQLIGNAVSRVWLLSRVACGKPLVHLVLRRNETTIQFEGTRRELIFRKISTIYHKEFSSDVFLSFFNFFQGGGGRELLTFPCPLKVQARPPRVQRLALLSRVSGQEWGGGGSEEREILTCPYPLKVQAHPPQNQRPALQSGQDLFSSFSFKCEYIVFM